MSPRPEPGSPGQEKPSRLGTIRLVPPAVWIYLRAAPGLFTVRLLTVVLNGYGPVAIAWFTKQILDRLATHRGSVTVPAVELAVTTAVLAVTQHITQYTDRELGRQVTRLTAARLFAAVNRPDGVRHLEDPKYHDRVRMAQQAAQMGPQQLTQALLGILQAVFMISGLLTSLLTVSPLASVMVLISSVPLLLAQLRLSRMRAGTQMQMSPHLRRQIAYSMLMLDLRAAKEIRLFGLGGVLERRMMTELGTAQRAERSVDRVSLMVDGSGALLTGLVSGIALIVVVTDIAAGRGTIGNLSLLIAAMSGIQSSIAGVIGQLSMANQVLLLFSHYHELTRDLDGPATRVRRAAPGAGRDQGAGKTARATAGPLRERIVLKDVWFRYQPDQDWVLRGVDLTLDAGTSTALVGLNGAGKSTLVKLLCRMYEPTRGSITWDGTDLAELDVHTLRARVGVLFQDFMTYDLTAHENIAVGQARMLADPGPDDIGLVRTAAGVAGVDDAIAALPQGYDTMLSRMFLPDPTDGTDRPRRGSRLLRLLRRGHRRPDGPAQDAAGAGPSGPPSGTLLSGGQWQRVALARAVLRQESDLLILDEPSSGLDAQAEHDIHARLVELRQDRTSLLISHRLSTVRDADQIVVLRSGRVCEQGPHRTLMALDGDYAALFRAQASGYQLDDQHPDGPVVDLPAATGNGHPVRLGATAAYHPEEEA